MNQDLLRRARRPESCKHVAVNTHIILLAALSDACRLPDTTLAARMLMGFELTGLQEDTGLFRPLPPPDLVTFDAMRAEIDAGNFTALMATHKRMKTKCPEAPLPDRQKMQEVTDEASVTSQRCLRQNSALRQSKPNRAYRLWASPWTTLNQRTNNALHAHRP